MKKLFGLLSGTLLVGLMSVGLVNNVKVDDKTVAAPVKETLEVKDVLKLDAPDGSGRTIKKAAAPAATYTMSDAKIQVSTPDADGNVDVRFVAAIDSFSYSNAQFIIEMFDDTNTSKGKITRDVTTAYTGIMLGDVVYSAADIFGEGHEYFIAYTLLDMPRDVWSYGFKVTTGLKQEADTDFTTKLTDEVKVVKSAIFADNHLVFNWLPYNDTWATLTWENDFVAGAVADLDPSVENYNDLITEVVKTNITAEITTSDGTVVYSNNSTHCSGSANLTNAINMQFTDFYTEKSEYTVKATVVLADGTEVTGVTKFNKLGDINNAKVEEVEGKYVLTFDAVENAISYTYKIFNDSYTGEVASINSGDSLAVGTLAVGTYSVEVTASAKSGASSTYAPSTVILNDVIVIEKTAEILDGSEKFEFELNHKDADWENVLRFKPIDTTDAITADSKITELKITRDDGADERPVSYVTRSGYENGAAATKAYPYYDATTGYYVVGFSIQETPNSSRVYEMTFVLETDVGQYYTIHLYYIAEETVTAIGASLEDVQAEFNTNYTVYNRTYYKNLLTTEYSKLNSSDYSSDNWNKIVEIYDNALPQFDTSDDPKGLYDTTLASINAIEANLGKLEWDVSTAKASSGTASSAVDGNTGSRWESTHGVDPQEITVAFTSVSYVSRLEIIWETASAKEYQVFFSADGTTWSDTPDYTFTDGSGARTDTIEFDTPIEAKAVKIVGISRTTGYGYSIFEMTAYGTVK